MNVAKIKKYLEPRLNIFHYVNLLILLIAFTLPFIVGSYTSDAKQEQLANYVAERVVDSTRSSRIMGLSVSSGEDSGALPGADDEFLRLYGSFRQTNATFISGYNLNKDINISFDSIKGFENLSIIYTGKDACVPYNNHYKHWTYPFELMFETPRLYDVSKYMIYISQSQADAFLEYYGLEKSNETYSVDDYKSLIKRTFGMNIGESLYTCVICNIYYEQNYYFSDSKELLNDYVLCAYYCPGSMNRENMYIFRAYSYENSYFMNYINKTYDNKKYVLNVINNNITKPLDDIYIKSFYYDAPSSVSSMFIFISVLLFAALSAVCILNLIKCSKVNIKYYLFHLFPILIPYLVFFVLYLTSKNVIFFSNFGIKLYVCSIIFYIGINFIIYAIRKIYDHYYLRKKAICKR